MVIEDILLKASNSGNSTVYGTAVNGNDVEIDEIREVWLFKRGTRVDKTEDFLKADINQLILDEKLIILKDVKELAPNNEENSKKTYGSGLKSVGRLGLYEFTATFEGGIGLYKSLASLTGNKRWDVGLVDSSNKLFLADYNTSIGGFKASYLSAELTTANNGTDPSFKTVMFQLSDTLQFDVERTYIDGDEVELDFEDDITPLYQIDYQIVGTLSDSDTSIVISTNSIANRDLDIADLLDTGGTIDTDSVIVWVDGVATAPSAVAKTGANQITATVTAVATGEVIEVSADPFSSDDGIFQASKSDAVTVG